MRRLVGRSRRARSARERKTYIASTFGQRLGGVIGNSPCERSSISKGRGPIRLSRSDFVQRSFFDESRKTHGKLRQTAVIEGRQPTRGQHARSQQSTGYTQI
jgi:hypothetical protein